MNPKPALFLILLLAAIIGVAFLLSILPQQIIWGIFILVLGGVAFLAKGKV